MILSYNAASSVLSVRVSQDERALLEAAAEQSRTPLSEFVRRKALVGRFIQIERVEKPDSA